MEVGYGWKLKNLKYPLSGLSHGNSGIFDGVCGTL